MTATYEIQSKALLLFSGGQDSATCLAWALDKYDHVETVDGLPNTFVPGRNLVFLTFAGALAYRRGITTLIGGMCEADFSGYPDCRKETLDAQMQTLSLGLSREMRLETPLMHLSKAGAWQLCEDMGGAPLVKCVNELTHSCYKGDHETLHDWGYGCGDCPACELRAAGWKAYSS